MSISVLMPVRDGARYVLKAVMSTLRALPSGAELIVYDDASRDETCKLLETVRDERLRVLQSRSAGSIGVAGALQVLLQDAKYPIVARMDADDICLPWRFRVQAKDIADNDVVFGSVVYINASGLPLRPGSLRAISETESAQKLLLSNPFVHPTMLARKEAVIRSGGYRRCGAEDYELWLRLAASGARIRKSALPVLLYRQHDGQVTAAKDRRTELRKSWFRDPALIESWLDLAELCDGARPTPEISLDMLMNSRAISRSGTNRQ